MGCVGSMNNANHKAQQTSQESLPEPDVKLENPLARQSPPLPTVPSRQTSVHNRALSTHSLVSSIHGQKSTKQSITNLSNDTEHRSSFHPLDNNTLRESDDVPLPPIANPRSKSKSHSSTRASSVVPPPRIDRPQIDSDSSSKSSKPSQGKSSAILNGQVGRCSHCPHCQQLNKRNILSSPKPKWLTQNPGTNQAHIIMDDYDAEAVKKKIISENGHLPGCYDYRPHLTIEQIGDYDQTKGSYYRQPVVSKTTPRILPTYTPFPEHDLLQRREDRVNKPYALPLFED